jgi:hypothetical protein
MRRPLYANCGTPMFANEPSGRSCPCLHLLPRSQLYVPSRPRCHRLSETLTDVCWHVQLRELLRTKFTSLKDFDVAKAEERSHSGSSHANGTTATASAGVATGGSGLKNSALSRTPPNGTSGPPTPLNGTFAVTAQ